MAADPLPPEILALHQRWERERTPQQALRLAEEYRRLSHHGRAVEVLEEGLEQHPRHVSSRVALGRYRLELDQPAAAARELEKVVDADPTHLVANKLLVRVYSSLGETAKARDRLDLYALLNESDPEMEQLERLVSESERAGEAEAAAPAAEPGPPPVEEATAEEEAGEEEGSYETSPPVLEPVEPSREDADEPAEVHVFDFGPSKPAPAEEPQPAAREAPAEPTPAAEQRRPGRGAEPFPELGSGLDVGRYWARLASEGIFDLGAGGAAAAVVAEPPPPPAAEPVPPTAEPGPASVTLARLYREQGHPEEAARVYREVLERQPGHSEALAALAELEPHAAAPVTAAELLAGAPAVEGEDPVRRKMRLLDGYLRRLRGRDAADV